VDLLQAGVPLETVSVLLGHSSIRVTEKHYSPWVKSRQLKLEESISGCDISSVKIPVISSFLKFGMISPLRRQMRKTGTAKYAGRRQHIASPPMVT
jgi:hypothetical protein